MIYNIVFSATGRCERVLTEFSGNWDGEKCRIDLSDAAMPLYNMTADDVCLVAVSVYGGRLPARAVPNLEKLNGNGAKAVLMAVYGNRAVDDALVELQDILTRQGFVCVAGIEAAAEHSIFPQYGKERPDAEDIAQLAGFAGQIKEYLDTHRAVGALTLPGNRPYMKAMALPFQPKVNDSCTGCKKCVGVCPAQAIPADNPRTTDKTKCMFCLRCIDTCPAKARVIPLPKPVYSVVGAVMKKELGGRKDNRLYIAE